MRWIVSFQRLLEANPRRAAVIAGTATMGVMLAFAMSLADSHACGSRKDAQSVAQPVQESIHIQL
jgi:hypothetical protein